MRQNKLNKIIVGGAFFPFNLQKIYIRRGLKQNILQTTADYIQQ